MLLEKMNTIQPGLAHWGAHWAAARGWLSVTVLHEEGQLLLTLLTPLDLIFGIEAARHIGLWHDKLQMADTTPLKQVTSDSLGFRISRETTEYCVPRGWNI